MNPHRNNPLQPSNLAGERAAEAGRVAQRLALVEQYEALAKNEGFAAWHAECAPLLEQERERALNVQIPAEQRAIACERADALAKVLEWPKQMRAILETQLRKLNQ